jgi:hypothetical protein
LQHLQVAIGIAGSEHQTATDEAVDADRLTGAVIDEFDVRQFAQHGTVAIEVEVGLAG